MDVRELLFLHALDILSTAFTLAMQKSKSGPDTQSCQSCRSRKLKCNRVQPCSNCTARGVTCRFLLLPRSRQEPTLVALAPDITKILSRIDRLESLVSQKPQSAFDQSTSSHVSAQSLAARTTLSDLGCEKATGITNEEKALYVLEDIGIRDDSLLPSLSNEPAFTVGNISEILSARSLQDPTNLHTKSTFSGNIGVVFPEYKIAMLLLDNYESNVDHVCRVVHIPTIRNSIKTFYLRITQHVSISLSQGALFLSIFSLSVFFYQPLATSEVSITDIDAVYLSRLWGKGTLDILDHLRRNTSGSLEDIQASILMSYVTYHLDGFSARCRLLMATAASLARDLRLHRLDADEFVERKPEYSPRKLIADEMKRRIFWHITASDWLNSSISGPQEGTYSIHPNHISVQLPKNCDYDEIILDGSSVEDESQPSSMAFLLARIKLAHLCREMTDTVPLTTNRVFQIPYEQIIHMDKQFEDFLSSLPVYFRLDPESRAITKPLEVVYPKIPITRYCITMAAYTRRCRLHHRFLLRQAFDSRYAFSRQVCLSSARVMIQTYNDSESTRESPLADMARMGKVIHFVHLALVVLIMDLCFNKDEVDQGDFKSEVQATFELLERVKHISPLLTRSLSALHDTLQKHKIQLPIKSSPPTLHHAVAVVAETESPGTSCLSEDGIDLLMNSTYDGFEGIIEAGEIGPDIVSWDYFFASLDSQPL